MRRWSTLLVLAACHRSTAAAPGDASVAPSVAPAASSVAAIVSADDGKRAVLRAWNDAHTAHDASALSALYADEVRFYGARLSRTACVSRVAAAMKKHPDESQTVKDVLVDGDTIRFVKTISVRGKPADYHAYLELARRGAGWAIAAESDTLTDQNLAPCTPLDWREDEAGEKTASVAGVTGHLGCGFVAPGLEGTVPPDQGSFCVIELDKPICVPPGAAFDERMTTQLGPYGDPHDLWKRYGQKPSFVVHGTVSAQRERHGGLAIALDP